MAKPAAQTFGKYQILERIATGGMAEIYKARLEGIGGFQRTFAIKRILPHLSANQDYIAMLVDEAKVAGLLSHANIVQILDLGQVDQIWYIAMEHVEGRDLGGVLKRARERGLVLPVPHAAFVAIELLKGLEYAHQRQVMRGGRAVPLNIIHRDISPPNVLLSFQGEVKLTDFGIARASHKALETQSGIIKGRFDYMSPEQAAGSKDLDQRSDLFSVGVVLYEMLTNEHPFRAESELGTLDKIRTGRYTPVSAKNPDVPFTLETIVDRALRVDKNERYPSATAFKEALDKFFLDSGFIFTQSTLAAYVRGLFPEVGKGGVQPPSPAISPAPPKRSEPPRPEPSRLPPPAADDDVLLEDEPDGPTRVIDARVIDEDRPTSLRDGGFGLAPAGEDATLIRSVPAIQPPPQAAWGDDQETQIRPSPFAARTPPPPARAEKAPPSTSKPPQTSSKPRSSGEPRSQPSVAGPRSSALNLLSFVLAAGAFGTGLLLGAAGAVIVLQLLGPAVFGTAGSATTTQLQVDAPPRAIVTIDGAPYVGPAAVEPNVPVVIHVEIAGRPAWERSVTLQPGETRVVALQVETP